MAAGTRVWSADDVQALPDDGNRYEVIDGELFVTPSASLKHQDIVLRLTRLLGDYLDRVNVGKLVIAPADVSFSNTRLVQPDLFVAALINGRAPRQLDEIRHLVLAVEVLSPATAREDRVAKRRLYREERVDEYWIIDPDSRTFERSTPDESKVAVLADEMNWRPAGATQSLTIDIPEFFASIDK
jgi:Uma2 family endonuclease